MLQGGKRIPPARFQVMFPRYTLSFAKGLVRSWLLRSTARRAGPFLPLDDEGGIRPWNWLLRGLGLGELTEFERGGAVLSVLDNTALCVAVSPCR